MANKHTRQSIAGKYVGEALDKVAREHLNKKQRKDAAKRGMTLWDYYNKVVLGGKAT